MAEISAQMVKELRECTGAGMMECKKALSEAEGDLDKAVDILRTRGLAALAKKAGRATNEGTIAAYVSEDAKIGTLVEVNSETDFVGRNAEFLGFVGQLAEHITAESPADVTVLMSQTVKSRDLSVEEVLGEVVSKLGENMGVARFERVEVTGNGAVVSYIHSGGKIGVLVELGFTKPETAADEAVVSFGRDIAMQVAATNPVSARRDEVPEAITNHEMEIYRAQAAESGKPEPIQEKMAAGRLEKYFKEVCLVEQVFVKDSSITVDQYRANVSKEIGDEITVVGFTRWTLGETAQG
jgi:elongation factor Ts